MEKTKFTARDDLEQLFDDDSNFSGSDSKGDNVDVYAYRGPTVSTSTLREEENLDDVFSGTGFIVKAPYMLDKLRHKNSIFVS